MSRYVVRITGPAGRVTYLSRGREVEKQENATRYPHPSNAWQAVHKYCARNYVVSDKTSHVMVDIIDTRDPERQVPA